MKEYIGERAVEIAYYIIDNRATVHTEAGCSGRLTTIITNLDVEPGKPMEEELCLYKKNGNLRCLCQALSGRSTHLRRI